MASGVSVAAEHFAIYKNDTEYPEFSDSRSFLQEDNPFYHSITSLGWSVSGCTFKEYNYNADGSGVSVQPGDSTVKDTVLYAIWEADVGGEVVL